MLNDGCNDKTLQIAGIAAKKHQKLLIKIESVAVNQGKVALFNQVIPKTADDSILFFSDVSAMLSKNVLKRANTYFNDPKIGAFCTKFQLGKHSLQGERTYWNYQSSIKALESRLGTPIGYHGSGYALRRSLWEPLPANTINDDFVMPMSVIAKGFSGIYDEESVSEELEISSEHLDWNRRKRISRGNIQQVLFLFDLLSPRHAYVAWMFFSSKVLRILVPWFLIFMFLSSFYLAFHNSMLFIPVFAVQLIFYVMAILNPILNLKIKGMQIISYFVKGQCSMFLGWLGIIRNQGNWQRAKSIPKTSYIHPFIRCGKWIMDKLGALVGISILIIMFPWIALLIKRSSPGPIFYKQLRVGQQSATQTHLFYLYKFRTMKVGADKSKSKWTKENDSRIYPFGSFLRKTHLDELPQFINVLKGDMSLIGPRPELPSLYLYIEKNIPFYTERLYEILPGLTGLAQISQGPDRTIEDVRNKVTYDHAYAIHLTKPLIWLRLELRILLKTIQIVLLGKGD